MRFHHYTRAPRGIGIGHSPQSYTFGTGRTYIVFAASGKGGTYHQLAKSHTLKQLPLVPAARAVSIVSHFESTPNCLPASSNARSARPRSSSEWRAETASRMRAWPSGTTG